ncbi:MAG: beta-glucuronidase [Treponema sp.]|nr:beta-glucuronidase [Treponema sp.]
MLYPLVTSTRTVLDLNGIWRFKFDPLPGPNGAGFNARFYEHPLEEAQSMPVPSSWNDLFEDQRDREFVGWVWYERDFYISPAQEHQVTILRFGSATHRARVYLNGKLVMEHVGGFTPFESPVDQFLVEGQNRLTVAVCNILDYSTLPVGTYTEQTIPGFGTVHKVSPNFDFYNYAGLHRPVLLYRIPKTHIKEIEIVTDFEGSRGIVDYRVQLNNPEGSPAHLETIVTVVDEQSRPVAEQAGNNGRIFIPDVRLWNPGAAYLYRLRVALKTGNELVDLYEEPFGVRTVAIKNGAFFINGKAFYFKGFGKHEDAAVRGRGLDQVLNLKDLRLIRWLGGNSLRTSHYCYSEEFMRLCDQEGIVVIDEVPAVGLMLGFNFDVSNMMGNGAEKPKTWENLKTKEAHQKVIEEMIIRDKNHPSVVMWSLSNESESWSDGAAEYFKPLYELARNLDPSKRPVTSVLIQHKDPTADKLAPLSDVICLNRYYGWYWAGGDLEAAKVFLAKELDEWVRMYPDKPILFTEYGADTIAGFHDTGSVMFTEEYQQQLYEAYHEVFDRYPAVVGEQAWNFADFATSQNVLRVQGNKKGIFTRERQPKAAAFVFKRRWESIPHFNYNK